MLALPLFEGILSRDFGLPRWAISCRPVVEVSSMKLASQPGLAVVTGAAGGLGRTFAKKLGERGYRLLLVDRRLEQLQQVCDSLTELGASAEPYAVDLTQRAEVERLANQLKQLDVE